MISENSGQFLHDKATRGESLTDNEQILLSEWYETQDKLEAGMLGITSVGYENTNQSLQRQIGTGLEKLMSVIQQIKRIITENEDLKREIAVLQSQMPRQAA
jgi:hypothetical protein